MSLERSSIEKRKWRAVRAAQFGLKQKLQRIDWEVNQLNPELDAIDAGKSPLLLTAGQAIKVDIVDDPLPPSIDINK